VEFGDEQAGVRSTELIVLHSTASQTSIGGAFWRPVFFDRRRLATSMRYRRSVLDRLLADPRDGAEGLTLTYSLDQLREAVARDVEALLNSRSAIDFDTLAHWPHARRSVVCFGIRDFVGRVLTNSEEQRHIASSLAHAIQAFEPRLRDVFIEFHQRPGVMNSLAFTIRAMLLAHPSAEPVAFDAVLQPSLSRFSVAPARYASFGYTP
jgi:type VI secretion system protein ImpF